MVRSEVHKAVSNAGLEIDQLVSDAVLAVFMDGGTWTYLPYRFEKGK